MTRTKQEIAQEIKSTFVANPILKSIYGISGLNEFDNEFSLASLESQLIEVFATSSKTMEDLMQSHLDEVEQKIAQMRPGTLYWYQQKALEYQHTDTLEWNATEMVYNYPVIDETHRLVKLASIAEKNNKLICKVAKLDVNENPVPLTPGELGAFRDFYYEKIKYAGVHIGYISAVADLLDLHLKIYFNASVLNNDGSLVTDSNSFPIQDKIKEYLYLIPFNGLFNVTALIDEIQKVKGVINPLFVSASAKGDASWQPVTDYYQPFAGYMRINNLTIDYLTL